MELHDPNVLCDYSLTLAHTIKLPNTRASQMNLKIMPKWKKRFNDEEWNENELRTTYTKKSTPNGQSEQEWNKIKSDILHSCTSHLQISTSYANIKIKFS